MKTIKILYLSMALNINAAPTPPYSASLNTAAQELIHTAARIRINLTNQTIINVATPLATKMNNSNDSIFGDLSANIFAQAHTDLAGQIATPGVTLAQATNAAAQSAAIVTALRIINSRNLSTNLHTVAINNLIISKILPAAASNADTAGLQTMIALILPAQEALLADNTAEWLLRSAFTPVKQQDIPNQNQFGIAGKAAWTQEKQAFTRDHFGNVHTHDEVMQ